MSSIPFAPALFPNTGSPTGDGGAPEGNRRVHGLYSEDLKPGPGGGIICGICASWAGGDYARYVRVVLGYHEIDLSNSGEENEFIVWFSGQPTTTEHDVKESWEKVKRWNKLRQEYGAVRR